MSFVGVAIGVLSTIVGVIARLASTEGLYLPVIVLASISIFSYINFQLNKQYLNNVYKLIV